MTKKDNYIFFKKNGYCILEALNRSDINTIRRVITNKINFLAKKNIFDLNNKKNKLDNYHELINSKKLHNKLMHPDTRYIKLPKKIVKKLLNPSTLFILKKEWGHTKSMAVFIGNAEKNKYIKSNAAGFRFGRPNQDKDVVGEHIDVNYGGKIRDRDDFLATSTLWIPIIGFSSKYTVRLAPKSHKFNHNKKLVKRGGKVTPAFSKQYVNQFTFIQPNLKIGQMILLHPNILHGASQNRGVFSRVSLNCSILNMNYNFQ